ncbi:MAG TPA: hypothetical protein ENI87_03480 [bacterium]|nr:hypothetical protein [bacterium]
MHPVSFAMAYLMAAGLSAQCGRPTPPPGGFPIDYTPTVSVSYSDGYQSFGSLLLPNVPAPACGWPLVVYVHPLGGSRLDEPGLRTLLAEQGYAVWSYDVRGQGQALVANSGHANEGSTLWGPAERHDLAEQIAFVAAEPVWQGVIDGGRLAVIGTSQGGAHAWLAAAWSGETIAWPGRTTMTFPQVACVVPRALVASSPDDWLRGGELFSSWWIEAVTGSYAALPLDPAFVQQARTAFVAQDPASLAAAWLAEGRDLRARLAASVVPTLYGHAYLDLVNSPLAGIEALASMAGSTRAMLGTIGHAVPVNDLEVEAAENLILRWFQRYLWGEPNEVDVEVRHVMSELPLDGIVRDDPSAAWNRGFHDDLTTPPTAARLFLHADGSLAAAVEPSPTSATLSQVVDPQASLFDPVSWFDVPAARDLATVLAACPLAEQVWATTVSSDQRLVRSATLHLELTPDASAWMVAALLTVQPPGGAEVMVAHRALASRTSVAGVAEAHDLRLPPVAVEVPAGASVRLRLRNLWLQEFPMAQRLDAAPIFGDFEVAIALGDAANGSWLDLPLVAVAPRLVVERQTLALDTLNPVTATLRGGVARAGDPYFVAVGLSGQVPSTPYLGEWIPLDVDWLVAASAASAASYYQGFLGFLDAGGEALCTLDYSAVAPLPQYLNGLHLTMAAFVWDYQWAPTGKPSNACELMLR